MDRKIRIRKRDGRLIQGILTPGHVRDGRLVIITTHLSYWSNLHPFNQLLARELSKAGFPVLRFSFYGVTKSSENSSSVTIRSQVADLRDVIAYARKNGYENMAVVGPSLGGTVAALACDRRIRTLVLVNPVFDTRILYHRYRASEESHGVAVVRRAGVSKAIGKEMWKEFGKLKLDGYVRRLACPVLVVYGAADSLVPISDIRRYYRMVESEKKLAVIKKGDHDFLVAGKSAAAECRRWIKTHL